MVWCDLSIDRHITWFTYQKRFCHSWVVTACCFRSLFTVGLSSCHLSSNCTPGRLEFKSKVDIFSTFSFNQRMISWQEHSIPFENLPHTVSYRRLISYSNETQGIVGLQSFFKRCSQNVTRGLGRTSISGIGLSTTQSTFHRKVFGKSETIFRKYKTKSGLVGSWARLLACCRGGVACVVGAKRGGGRGEKKTRKRRKGREPASPAMNKRRFL